MSVPLEIAALHDQVARCGPIAHLVTVNRENAPHVVAVEARWDDGEIVANAGRTTVANAAAHPAVTVLWAAPPGEAYSLLVDGEARLEGEASLRVEPRRAVLHRTPAGDPGAPACITVLDRR